MLDDTVPDNCHTGYPYVKCVKQGPRSVARWSDHRDPFATDGNLTETKSRSRDQAQHQRGGGNTVPLDPRATDTGTRTALCKGRVSERVWFTDNTPDA